MHKLAKATTEGSKTAYRTALKAHRASKIQSRMILATKIAAVALMVVVLV